MQGKDVIGGGGVVDRGSVNINRLHAKNVIIVALRVQEKSWVNNVLLFCVYSIAFQIHLLNLT